MDASSYGGVGGRDRGYKGERRAAAHLVGHDAAARRPALRARRDLLGPREVRVRLVGEGRVDGHARVARVAVREEALEAAGVRRRDFGALVDRAALALEELLVVVVDVLLFLMGLVVVGELLQDARRDVERRDEDELMLYGTHAVDVDGIC